MSDSKTTNGGLIIEDIKEGTGEEVHPGDYITIHYNGTLEDGTKFDSSYDRGAPFQTRIGVGQVIEGWDLGVIGMRKGGKRKLVIPSHLAYGDRAVGDVIKPNSTLVFEVELVSID
jgi:peptidylprolyl isomerase